MENRFYLGIDLDNRHAVVSFHQLNRKEPETVSMIAGSERFQIPLCIAKQRGVSHWTIGEEAKKMAADGTGVLADELLERALSGDTVALDREGYPAKELLGMFIKKLIFLAGNLLKPVVPDMLVISLETLSREITDMFLAMAPSLGLKDGQVTLLDRQESFYYFACSQKEELYLHDVCLFDYRDDTLICRRLQRNIRTTPQLVVMAEDTVQMEGQQSDIEFLQIAQDFMRGCVVSAIYLIGDGFDGEWMKASLAFLCKGRRVFLGKNLYSKGACYAAAVKEKLVYWPFIYMGATEMKVNVSLKVKNCGRMEFFTLISAGDNWYETVGECEVILSGTPEIDFWLQAPSSREAKIEKLELSDFPKRPDKTTRLRITAKPLSDTQVQVSIKDLGFGEFFKSSDKVWEYVF